MLNTQRVAVVTGGNRGIGLEICRQLSRPGLIVILTSRSEETGRAAVTGLHERGYSAGWSGLDVDSDASIQAFAEKLRSDLGRVDILINNAGVSFNGFNARIARRTVATNFFGALHLTDALLPLMQPGGRVVMVSSGMGERALLAEPLARRFHDPTMTRDELVALMTQFVDDVATKQYSVNGWPSSAYCVSKIGMTKLAEVLARELAVQRDRRGILINAACPGWVRTDMGGSRADRSIEEGADTPVWLALLDQDGPTGGFFRDRQPATW